MIKTESGLYDPLRAYFENLGFDVQAEVKGCDLVARKNDTLVIVEQKLRLNLELILQGVDRLDISEHVYLAVPAPKRTKYPPEWKRLRRLLVRLGLGLLFVRELPSEIQVEPAVEPGAPFPGKSKKRLNGLLREMELRQSRTNTGGVTRTKLMTAYREQALLIAFLLSRLGEASPGLLRSEGAPEKTGSILYSNFYGWFIRSGKGIYELSPKGSEALVQYRSVVKKITASRKT